MARRELPVGGADLPELSQLAPEATRVLGAWLRDVVKANPSNSEHMCQEWLEGYLLTGPAPPWTPLPPHDNTSVTPGGGLSGYRRRSGLGGRSVVSQSHMPRPNASASAVGWSLRSRCR